MTDLINSLWIRLNEILKDFSKALVINDSSVTKNIGHTSNNIFILRGYLEIRHHKDGDEFSIGIDIKRQDKNWFIESDICFDNGEIIAIGPSAVILLSDQSRAQSDIDTWAYEFEKFLIDKKNKIESLINDVPPGIE
ncbi:hypothetical protein P3G55_22760 [Leptospira sp. 96542]|nr:hypothetical protein [Leptospira sp. 96542]